MSSSDDEAPKSFSAMKVRIPNLEDAGVDLLFHEGRTCYQWLDRRVPKELLVRLVAMTQLPPTSANSLPARFVFVRTRKGKEKLKPCLSSGNIAKTMAAPVTAIIAYDPKFWKHLDRLFPHGNMKSMFEKNPEMAEEAGFRNGSLMGGYMILAARSLGLDCGPMSGFDSTKVNSTFLSGTSYKTNFLCNIGYGDPASVKSRGPKFTFHEVASIV